MTPDPNDYDVGELLSLMTMISANYLSRMTMISANYLSLMTPDLRYTRGDLPGDDIVLGMPWSAIYSALLRSSPVKT